MKGVQRKVQGKFFARRKTERGDHLGEVVREAEESLRQDGRAEPGRRRVLFLGGRNGEAFSTKNPFYKEPFCCFCFSLFFTKHSQPASEKSLQRRR